MNNEILPCFVHFSQTTPLDMKFFLYALPFGSIMMKYSWYYSMAKLIKPNSSDHYCQDADHCIYMK